jgi:hypothetical protein
MKATITARLWKRRRPAGPWTPATVAELRQLTNRHTRPKGWTLTAEDVEILLRRMQEHTPEFEAGPWAFMWGDPQLTLFELNSIRTHEIAPLHRTIPGGRGRRRAVAVADRRALPLFSEIEAE